MIAEWDTDALFISDLPEQKYPALVAALRATLIGVPIEIIPGTADIWCRDYMPLQLDQDRFCQFVYAPDYLRGHEELITPPDKCRRFHATFVSNRIIAETARAWQSPS